MTIASYIKESHEESVRLATQLLDYKPWLSLDAIAQIEEVRNSDLSKVIIAISIPELVAFLDNDDTRDKLGIQVFGLWSLIRKIKLQTEQKTIPIYFSDNHSGFSTITTYLN